MLEYFRFKNFKSYEGEALLNMTASKSQKFDYLATTVGNTRIINLATIIGNTGSGKSGVLEAMEYAVDFIRNSLTYNEGNMYRRNTFTLTDSKENSYFEFGFVNDTTGSHYIYGFSLDDTDVTEELLYKKSKTAREYRLLMKRTPTCFEFQGLQSRVPFCELPLQKGNLMLTYGCYLNIEPLKEIYEWFESSFIFVHLNRKGNTSDVSYMMSKRHSGDKLLDMMKQVDDTITNIKVTSDEWDDIFITHGYNEIEMGSFLTDECSGIQMMLKITPALYRALTEGKILVMDNFGDGLHTLLSEYLYKMFAKHCNKNNAQMITATTYTRLLDLTRLDGVWFTSKDDKGCSELYGLRDFKNPCVRVDSDISKNYLAGRYGAVPKQKEVSDDLLKISLWS